MCLFYVVYRPAISIWKEKMKNQNVSPFIPRLMARVRNSHGDEYLISHMASHSDDQILRIAEGLYPGKMSLIWRGEKYGVTLL